jgi:hypothetical protein
MPAAPPHIWSAATKGAELGTRAHRVAAGAAHQPADDILPLDRDHRRPPARARWRRGRVAGQRVEGRAAVRLRNYRAAVWVAGPQRSARDVRALAVEDYNVYLSGHRIKPRPLRRSLRVGFLCIDFDGAAGAGLAPVYRQWHGRCRWCVASARVCLFALHFHQLGLHLVLHRLRPWPSHCSRTHAASRCA